jgi:hypothetical protein
MYRILLTVAAMSVAVVNLPASASAQIAATQIMLTEKQIKEFIAAKEDMVAVVQKMQDTAPADYEAELDAIAKRHGFKSLAEHDAVATNISLVTAAIDPQTKVFTDPRTAIEREIADVSANNEIPIDEKSELLESLNEALKAAEPIQFPNNIKLVQKYYEKLDEITFSNLEVGQSFGFERRANAVSE